MRLTVTENQIGNGHIVVVVYDEQDKEFAKLSEDDLDSLYFNGVFNEKYGSYKFKEQVKRFVKGN
jgi:hypothetical protein